MSTSLTIDEQAILNAELAIVQDDLAPEDLHDLMKQAASAGSWFEVTAIAIRIQRLTTNTPFAAPISP